jgi:Rad3-related DNA helicase
LLIESNPKKIYNISLMTSAELLKKLEQETQGFEVRSSQTKMLEACESVLTNKGVLLVEAPTGVGKTF